MTLCKEMKTIPNNAIAIPAASLCVSCDSNPGRAAETKERFTYRMHDLGQFMKGLLQGFPQWFNARHKRTGTLSEQRFKSVIERYI